MARIRSDGPPGWPEVWPVDWNKESGANQSLDHIARHPGMPTGLDQGERAQGRVTGHVPDTSNNRDSDFLPRVEGGPHHGDDAYDEWRERNGGGGTPSRQGA